MQATDQWAMTWTIYTWFDDHYLEEDFEGGMDFRNQEMLIKLKHFILGF